MTKHFLVAQREFLDNVRTKTFWFGILVIPIIWVGAFLIGRVFEDTKDVRPYAVLDQSGWLDAAVTEKLTREDFDELVRRARDLADSDPAGLAKLPPEFRRLAERMQGARLAEVGREVEQLVAERMRSFERAAGVDDGNQAERSKWYQAPAVSEDEHAAERAAFVAWWEQLSSPEARKLGADTFKDDYHRVPVPASEDPEAWLREELGKGPRQLFAYFVFGSDPVGVEEQPKGFKYVSNNTIDKDLRSRLSGIADEEARRRRFQNENISDRTADRILKPLNFRELQLDAEGGEASVSDRDKIRQFAPMAFTYLLWITVFITVQMLLTNTIEEKSNRIIEVLLSSVSPLQLMIGKVLGIAATGLTMILSWIAFSILALKYLPKLLGGGDMPDLMVFFQEPIFIWSFIGYFICGYLLYAAILVGLGSVCNSLKEAQNLMNPVMILLIVPLVAMMPVSKDPNGTLAKILSFIPFFTPFTMMNRSAGPPELWEYAATGVLLILSILFAFWAAAKIFRIGILMTGKPPRPTEILRWLRAPVGSVPEVKE